MLEVWKRFVVTSCKVYLGMYFDRKEMKAGRNEGRKGTERKIL
jgi:hypothetical protein